MNILIVDDEKIEREALKYFFKRSTFNIEVVGEATNGLHAVEMNKILCPDVILMDIRMGIMSGLEASERIKIDTPGVEIIILTAFGKFEYSQQAIRYGVFDYLLKPIEERELFLCLNKVRTHLEYNRDISSKLNSRKLLSCWLEEKTQDDAKFNSYKDKRISTIVQYVLDNLDKQISLDSIALTVHTTPEYLSRFFKSETGVLISKFILQARIEKSKFLLINEREKPLKNIAEEVGFSTVQHFCNTFKKVENITPSNFRLREGRTN